MGTGLSHMEWFRRPDGRVAVSEVGARPPGAQITSLISYAHDLDFYRAWGRLVVFDQFDAAAARLRRRRRLPARPGRRAGPRHPRASNRRRAGSATWWSRSGCRRSGQSPSASYEGDGYVIVRHRETRAVDGARLKCPDLANVRVELG